MLVKNTREYGRYAIASLMLASGILGLWLGGYWVWLGLSGFVSIAVIDWFAEPDHSLRAGTAKWFYNAILYVQLPLMITLWVLFALHLRAGDLNAFNLVGALLSVSFLSALAGLPAAHELMHRKHPFEIFYSSLYLTVFGLPLRLRLELAALAVGAYLQHRSGWDWVSMPEPLLLRARDTKSDSVRPLCSLP